jgi:nitrite reductase/ring-hydroxylating ferredoxin subunit
MDEHTIGSDTDGVCARFPDGRLPTEQPKWRRDFPIDSAEDDYVSRRELVKFIVLTSAAFAVGQAVIAAKSLFARRERPTLDLLICEVDELPVNGAKTFHYPPSSTPRLLVRTGPTEFVAYDQQCTHLQCPIVPAVEQGKLHCPCHNGWFNLQTGEPIAGPPRRRLARVLLEVRGSNVYATGVDEGAT